MLELRLRRRESAEKSRLEEFMRETLNRQEKTTVSLPARMGSVRSCRPRQVDSANAGEVNRVSAIDALRACRLY
jgi:hypothetical protein